MAANASPSEVECTCPVCCEIFKDPVLLLCGHSFCKSCLQEWWRKSTQQTCPVCKEIFPMGEPPRNLALRNLSDALRQERSQKADSASEELCSLHSEKLKLFCHDDQQLVCLICRDSLKHKKHNCVPVNEAAEAQRTQLKVQLMTLKSKLESFNRVKLNCDKMKSHIKLQAEQTEKTIKEEFQRLYRFLRAQEVFRVDAVRKEATLKTEAMRIRILNLTAQISLVSHKIKTIKNEMRAEDDSFMLKDPTATGEINRMAANTSPSEVECTCPVCCDIFQDPVILLCGHSFCKSCLQEWWRQSRLHSCPVSKKIFPVGEPPRNLALRNLSDALRQERSQKANSKEFCSLHREELKLFCQDDQQLVCLICRDSQKHKKHNFIPVNEAAEAQRNQLNVQLMTLKSKRWSFTSEKDNCDKMKSHIKLQAQQTEKTIKEEFQKLYQFLRAEEAARVDAVRKEAMLKTEAMKIRIINLTAEISSLTKSIETIEKEMRADDISFMLNVKSIMQRSQCNLPEPETPSGALIDEAKHLGNLLFSVWKKMKNKIEYTLVTLDPNTASSRLTLSKQMSCSAEADKDQGLPRNPERRGDTDVLGSEGFRSGNHSWDVEVGGFWALGVAATSGPWGIYKCDCHVVIHELTPEECKGGGTILHDTFPEKVRVQLDYDRGTLSFFDLDRRTVVHTIRHTFTEPVFPYFGAKARILPAEFSVEIRQPR
ncbi:E3 ubiquitin-protein ligase TRIM35-like [Acanthopagrus schlegelii]